MCTLTWLLSNTGYEVFCNRDELLSRSKAVPPAYNETLNSLLPIDPDGGGTWIAVNAQGMTLCLLNKLQHNESPTGSAIVSRGGLIPQLMAHRDGLGVRQGLDAMDLSCYRPFILCIFPVDLNVAQGDIELLVWDGSKCQPVAVQQPLISSVSQTDPIRLSRRALFDQMLDPLINPGRASHLKYHASHWPRKGQNSVCMHRRDAQTQSLSHICVARGIQFAYHNGPPCEARQWQNIRLKRS